MAVQDIRAVSPWVKMRTGNLWLSLIDSDGDPGEIRRLLDNEALDDPQTFLRVMGLTMTLWHSQTWPLVVNLLEKLGVPREQLAEYLRMELKNQMEEYLRSDVTVEEAGGV